MFVDDDGTQAHVESEFLCVVCRGVMADPRQAPGCLHDFGMRCVVPAGAEESDPERVYRCPEQGCTTSFTADQVQPCAKLGRLIARLPVGCPNECGWHGAWGSSQKHVEKACHLEQINCPFGCGECVPRRELIDHKKQCDRRVTQCQYCLTQHRFINVHLHEDRCDLKPVSCSGCNAEVKLAALPRHKVEECGATMVSCPFVDFGCPEHNIPRRDVDDHIQANLEKHCSLLMRQIQKERGEYSEHIALLENRIASLEGRCGIGSDGKANSNTPAGQAALHNVEELTAKVQIQQELIDKFMNANVLVVDASGLGGARTSIQRAIEDARPNDVVLVRPGTYTEDLNLTKPKVWVRGTDREGVVLKGRVHLNWEMPNNNTPTSRRPSATTTITTDKKKKTKATPCGDVVADVVEEDPELQATRLLEDASHIIDTKHTLDNLAISNLTIDNNSKTHPALRVACMLTPFTSKPRIQNCTITCSNMSCVVVESGNPSFETCSMSGSKQFGVYVRGSTATPATRRDSEVSNSSIIVGGVEEGESGGGGGGDTTTTIPLVVTSSPTSQQQDDTTNINHRASCRLVNCTIHNNKEPNLLVERGHVYLSGCDVGHGDANGVLVKAGGVLEGRATTFHHNRFSNLDVMKGGKALLHNCHSHSSKKGGAFIVGEMFAVASTFFGNEMPNIVVMPRALLSLVNSKVNSSLQYGLVVKRDGSATLRGCEVKGNCLDNVIGEEGAVVDM